MSKSSKEHQRLSEKEYHGLKHDTITEELMNDDGYREWCETIEKQQQEQEDDESTRSD